MSTSENTTRPVVDSAAFVSVSVPATSKAASPVTITGASSAPLMVTVTVLVELSPLLSVTV